MAVSIHFQFWKYLTHIEIISSSDTRNEENLRAPPVLPTGVSGLLPAP